MSQETEKEPEPADNTAGGQASGDIPAIEAGSTEKESADINQPNPLPDSATRWKRLGSLMQIGTYIAILLVGICAGVLLAMQIYTAHEELSAMSVAVLIAGVCFGGWALFLTLKSALHRLTGGGWSAVFSSALESGTLLLNKPAEKRLSEHLSNRDLASALVQLRDRIGTVLSLHSWLAMAISLTTITFAILGSLVAYVQIRRMDIQNALLSTQNRITVAEQEFVQSSANADAAYNEVRDLLLGKDSTVDGQIFGLKRFPVMMSMAVIRAQVNEATEADATQSGLVQYLEYPNVKRGRQLLRHFIQTGANRSTLPRKFLVRDPVATFNREEIYQLKSLQPLSQQLMKTLHVLGPRGGSGMEQPSLWTFDPDEQKTPPPPRDEPKATNSESEGLDLTHFGKDELKSLHIPFFNSAGFQYVRFTSQADLSHAVFTGSYLKHVFFNQADLSKAHFETSTLVNGWFESANLFSARMASSSLINVRANHAIFTMADLSGSRISQGGSYAYAKFSWVNLAGSVIDAPEPAANEQPIFVDMRGVNFNQADMRYCWVKRVDATGAYFRHTRLAGSILSKSKLDGAALFGAKMAPEKVNLWRLETTRDEQRDALWFEGIPDEENSQFSELKPVEVLLPGTLCIKLSLQDADLAVRNAENMDQLRDTQDQFNKETAPMSDAAIQDMHLVRDQNTENSGVLLDGQAIAEWEKEALDQYVKPGLWRQDKRPPLLIAELAEEGVNSLDEALPALAVKNDLGSAMMDQQSADGLISAAKRQIQRLVDKAATPDTDSQPTILQHQRSVLDRLQLEIQATVAQDQSTLEQQAGFRIQR